MADELPDNLSFMGLGADDAETQSAGAEPEVEAPGDDGAEQSAAPQPEATDAPAALTAPPVAEGPNDKAFRGVLRELQDTRQERRMLLAELETLRREREARENPQATEEEPDKDADPAAWLAWQQRQNVDALRQEMYEREEMARQQEETRMVRDRFMGDVVSYEEQFRQVRPDYDQAVEYVRSLRVNELTQMGLDPEQVEHQVRKEIIGFSALNLRNGVSPAEAAYNYAMARGYRTTQPQAQPAFQSRPSAPQMPVVDRSLSSTTGSAGAGRKVDLSNLAQQPTQIQNMVYDDPELWERINMGEPVYL